MMSQSTVILGVTGSIGAYKAADLVRRLKEQGCAVTVVMTTEACQFITPLTLQALSERKVHVELFSLEEPSGILPAIAPLKTERPGGASQQQPPGPKTGGGVIHTALADHANLVVIAPATAHVIAKLAHGLADDVLTCVTLATKAPVLLAPAMNVHMYEHPLVQENIQRLRRIGYRMVGPQVGRLACGYDAIGHLAEVEEIVQAALHLLAPVGHPAPAATASRQTAVRSAGRPIPRRMQSRRAPARGARRSRARVAARKR